MIPVDKLGPHETVFTHVNTEDQSVKMFAISRLMVSRALRQARPIYVQMDPVHARFVAMNRGIDIERCKAMPMHIVLRPILMVHLADEGTHLTIDGHHRYYANYLLGHKEIMALILQPEEWEPFLIELPEYAIKGIAERILADGTANSRG